MSCHDFGVYIFTETMTILYIFSLKWLINEANNNPVTRLQPRNNEKYIYLWRGCGFSLKIATAHHVV